MDRLFLGVPIPPPTADRVASLADDIPGVRWTPTANLHLTLHFVGDAESAAVDRAVQATTGAPFTLQLRGGGCFKARGGGVTLWIGIEANSALTALHAALAAALRAAELPVENRPYAPHATVARSKTPLAESALAAFRARAEKLTLAPVEVREFALYRSVLRPAGSVYEIVGRYPLAASIS